jgi:hypothetical protein
MPARDRYYDAVRNALVKDGWTITHDPLYLTWGARDLFVDLGAERLLAADKEGRRIAVEIKSFTGRSAMTELERALGQFALYNLALSEQDPGRSIYLAVPDDIMREFFEGPHGEALLRHGLARVCGFDPIREEIVKWMP